MSEKDPSSWWSKRLAYLADRIAVGDYWVPAEDIAHAIMFGRPKWGDNPVATGDVLDQSYPPVRLRA